VWSDLDWAARAERLPVPDTTPAGKAVPDSGELTAVAS
jgi:hypothetical protein